MERRAVANFALGAAFAAIVIFLFQSSTSSGQVSNDKARLNKDTHDSRLGTIDSVLPLQANRKTPSTQLEVRSAQQARTYSLEGRGRTIRVVLDEFAADLGLTYFASDIPLDRTVNGKVEDGRVEDVFRELFPEYDLLFSYASTRDSIAKPIGVWIYPAGTVRLLTQSDLRLSSSVEDFRARLSNPLPDERAAAIEAVIDRFGNRAEAEISRALADPEEIVRVRALSTVVRQGIDMSIPTLRQSKRLQLVK